MRFLGVFWSLHCWIDLILHIMIVQNVSQHFEVVIVHERPFKTHKIAFLDDPKSHFIEFG